MDKLPSLTWSQVQIFLAVAEAGSLSGGARTLGSSQPTLSRQIKEIETLLGAALFHRQARGLALTATGAELVASARKMRDAMQEFTLTAAGQDQKLAGSVRITASVFISQYVLPSIIADIRAAEPDITIDLIPSDDSENLLFREADIAVRMYRSEQLDIITKQIGVVPIGMFAAKSYLDRRGRPQSATDLQHHDLVGYDRDDRIIQGLQAAGIKADRNWFSVRCDAQANYWELVRAGCGIGFSQINIAIQDAKVEQVLTQSEIPPLPIWLAAPEAMRSTPRIRRIWALLEQGLLPFIS